MLLIKTILSNAFALLVVVGVIMPLELEKIGADPTEVVFVGRFVDAGVCQLAAACPREFLIDHVAWTSGA